MGTPRRERKKSVSIPNRFEPQFWNEADKRCAVVKEIRRRYALLLEDTGADSYQQDLLCQRAIFVSVQLETMERLAAETGKFDPGVYTQMTNSLLGLLKSLGLERKTKKVLNLERYVKERGQ